MPNTASTSPALHIVCQPYDNRDGILRARTDDGNAWEITVYEAAEELPAALVLASVGAKDAANARDVVAVIGEWLCARLAQVEAVMPYRPGDPDRIVLRTRFGACPARPDCFAQTCTATDLDDIHDPNADARRWSTWAARWATATVLTRDQVPAES